MIIENNIIYLLLLSYLIGSIPFGLILPKIFGYGDIRKIGSGNIGATNVLRTGNKKIAISVLLLDFLKCYLPTLFILHIYNLNIASFCGLFSIIGHIFSVWVYFKGGKGIACFFGFLLAINIGFFIIILIIWLMIAYISKYSSLASIFSSIITFFLFFIYDTNINNVIPLTIIILVIFKHMENIKRLINKKENKIKL
tara:strand:- start:2329 stop:2919 length:591 start_codon:yes stop_codon:yes gene_type:complete